jgi:hypothetical protein
MNLERLILQLLLSGITTGARAFSEDCPIIMEAGVLSLAWLRHPIRPLNVFQLKMAGRLGFNYFVELGKADILGLFWT